MPDPLAGWPGAWPTRSPHGPSADRSETPTADDDEAQCAITRPAPSADAVAGSRADLHFDRITEVSKSPDGHLQPSHRRIRR